MRIMEGECLNCGSQINKGDYFCSNCGQKVDNNDIRLKSVIAEFFENYLALDTSLGRSLFPFFFKPGYLPHQFMIGVRRSFVNPFRLYIFTSIFFFFCLNSTVQKNRPTSDTIIQIDDEKLKGFEGLSETDQAILNKALNPSTIESLNDSTHNSFTEALRAMPKLKQQQIIKLLSEESLQTIDLNTDSILADNSMEVTWNSGSEGVNIDFNFDEIQQYRYDSRYSNEMLFDSLTRGEEMGGLEEMFYRRALKLYRADPNSLSKQILGNLSLAMFVLIPLFAFILMLFYWRRNKYYVAHLIHTIYLQSFAFTLFGISLLFYLLIGFSENILFWILRLSAILFAIYFIASFRVIYKQGWFKLLFKSASLLAIYIILSAVVFLGEVVVSFLIF